MTADQVFNQVLPEAYKLLPASMNSPEASVMLLAIGLQESRFASRRQLVNSINSEGRKVLLPLGPAKGYWQMEKGGAVKGLLNFWKPATKELVHSVCKARGVPATQDAVWDALEHDDVLACALARILLYTDPHRLPPIKAQAEAWDFYLRQWRPGQPHEATWPELYRKAVRVVTQ
ncbi:lysozyme [Pseudomonas phage YH30]|uniref:Lysozyme n=1 Tax=Pseudomonas phage YH30 TaxID=1636189 RepID=A0A0E3XD07_9CAUD|nr:lysozyme [Pseudomonas phage YH30]AKC04799.1 lysozyme [Pseudomonas phage YH30]